METLSYPTGYNDQWKNRLRKDLTQYFSKNHILYKQTKNGTRKVILQDQVEPIIYYLYQDMSEAHLGIDVIFEKVKERYF